MKLYCISDNTRRDFLKQAGALVGSSSLGVADKIVGALGRKIGSDTLHQKVIAKYVLPKLFNKTEDEIIQLLAINNPGKVDVSLLKQITDNDIVAGLLSDNDLCGLLEIVEHINIPDWLRQTGINAIHRVVNKIGPIEAIKQAMSHKVYSSPQALGRLENLINNVPKIARLMDKVGLADLNNMTPQKFDALERLTGERFTNSVRRHCIEYQNRIRQAKSRSKQTKPQPKQTPDVELSDYDLNRWENEGGYARTFEERLNKILQIIE